MRPGGGQLQSVVHEPGWRDGRVGPDVSQLVHLVLGGGGCPVIHLAGYDSGIGGTCVGGRVVFVV